MSLTCVKIPQSQGRVPATRKCKLSIRRNDNIWYKMVMPRQSTFSDSIVSLVTKQIPHNDCPIWYGWLWIPSFNSLEEPTSRGTQNGVRTVSSCGYLRHPTTMTLQCSTQLQLFCHGCDAYGFLSEGRSGWRVGESARALCHYKRYVELRMRIIGL